MLSVKKSVSCGCTFLGKGIVGHPEMGVVYDCREVTFDEWDLMRGEWLDREETRIVYKTDNGYVFDQEMLHDKAFEIELYAENWRAHKGECFA